VFLSKYDDDDQAILIQKTLKTRYKNCLIIIIFWSKHVVIRKRIKMLSDGTASSCVIVHRERDGCHPTGRAVSLCDLGGDEASFFCQMNMNISLSRMRCEGECKVQEVTKFAIKTMVIKQIYLLCC
jgi:hypothetical protein